MTDFLHGARCVLPPSKTLALVELVEPADAKRGFRKLAYKKFKGVPLFLEWAPMAAQEAARQAVPGNASSSGTAILHEGEAASVAAAAQAAAEEKEAEMQAEAEEEEEEAAEAANADESSVDSRTIFVKNVKFQTSEATLKETFEGVMGRSTVKSVSLPKKTVKLRGKPNVQLPTGFGFVEMSTPAVARQALRRLQGTDCEGHALQLSLSDKGTAPPKNSQKAQTAQKNKQAPTSKLLIRNVPFETNKKELRELFGTFGQVKALRLPRKFDGSHR
jgi:multiple RNA-binding domain-containing protein 1